MALLSIACPECGARVKSSKGFKRGQAVSCPKCETDFTVGETASADESLDKEWSYKNSWMRFAVLGVLLVVLGVLGYMLYDKKRNEGKDTAGGGDDEDTARLVEPRIAGPAPKTKLVPVIPAGGPGPRKANGEPQPLAQTQADEMKKALVGAWETKREDETHTVEYNADGSFTYNVDGKAKKSIEGQWKVAGIEPLKTAPGTRNLIARARMEWVPEGQEAVTGTAHYNERGSLTHPLLDRAAGGKAPLAVFNRKD